MVEEKAEKSKKYNGRREEKKNAAKNELLCHFFESPLTWLPKEKSIFEPFTFFPLSHRLYIISHFFPASWKAKKMSVRFFQKKKRTRTDRFRENASLSLLLRCGSSYGKGTRWLLCSEWPNYTKATCKRVRTRNERKITRVKAGRKIRREKLKEKVKEKEKKKRNGNRKRYTVRDDVEMSAYVECGSNANNNLPNGK